MTRYLFLLILLPMAVAIGTGCQGPVMQRRQHNCPTCNRLGGGRVADGLVSGRHARGYNQEGAADPGPAAAAVAYPYYTLRGPRDFLTNSPPSIGP